MISWHFVAIIASILLSVLSQVLLKKSSGEVKKNFISDYLNVKVITAYLLYFFVTLLVVYAYTGIEYRFGTALGSLTYLLTMIGGRIFFKEKMTTRRVVGNGVIVLGVIVFSFNM